MSIDHNRIKVGDLEINQPNKILTTDENGVLEFSEINNTLDCTIAGKALDARQGKILKDLVDNINAVLTSDNINLNTFQELADSIEILQSSLNTILVNDLSTGGTTKALTAEMGKVLENSKVDKVVGERLINATEVNKLGNQSGINTGDNAVNSNYVNDYRSSNFISGTDYLEPNGSAAGLTSFPTFNQNTTGTASTITGNITESQVTSLITDLAAKQDNITLTTTGTSGPATLVGSTLNIPSYSGGGSTPTLQQVGEAGSFSYNVDTSHDDVLEFTWFSINDPNPLLATEGAINMGVFNPTISDVFIELSRNSMYSYIKDNTAEELTSLGFRGVVEQGKELNFELPTSNKVSGNYTLATLDDIPSYTAPTLQSVLNAGNSGEGKDISLYYGNSYSFLSYNALLELGNTSGGQTYQNRILSNGYQLKQYGVLGEYNINLFAPTYPPYGNDSVNYRFPSNVNGDYTIATTDDIPDTSNLVPYSGAINPLNLGSQSLYMGNGTIGGAIHLRGNKGEAYTSIENSGTSVVYDMTTIKVTNKQLGGTKTIYFGAPSTGDDFNLQFPGKSGTLATLDDIPSYSGGGGVTNLSYTASSTNGIVNSDTGTGATIPLADATNAGLLAPADFTKFVNLVPVSATVPGIVDNTSLQELGGVDKLINGVRVGKGNNTAVGSNTVVGNNSQAVATTATYNTSLGFESLRDVTSSSGNTAFGGGALKSLTSGNGNNSAFGVNALRDCTTGFQNLAFGSNTLLSLTTGTYNTAVSALALSNLVTGNGNTAVGAAAGNGVKGDYNTSIGYLANGYNSSSTGNYNTTLGFQAGRALTTGSNNMLLETPTGGSITTGSSNIIINSGTKNTGLSTGSGNTVLGGVTGLSAADTGLVVIANGTGTVAIRKETDNRLLAPTLTNALINSGGSQSLVTKGYTDLGLTINGTNVPIGGSISVTTAPQTVTVIPLAANYVNTTVTRTTVTGWTFNVTAGKRYKVEIIGSYQTAVTTTGGSIGFILSSGAGTIMGIMNGEIVQTTGATGQRATIRNIDATNTTVGSFITTTGVGLANSAHYIGGVLNFNCTTSGVFEVQFASEIAASSAQLNAGSLLLVTEY